MLNVALAVVAALPGRAEAHQDIQLDGSALAEQNDEWPQLQRRYTSLESMQDASPTMTPPLLSPMTPMSPTRSAAERRSCEQAGSMCPRHGVDDRGPERGNHSSPRPDDCLRHRDGIHHVGAHDRCLSTIRKIAAPKSQRVTPLAFIAEDPKQTLSTTDALQV